MDIDNTRSAASSDNDMSTDTSSDSDAMDIDAPPSSPGRVDRIKLAWYCDANKRLNDENVRLMAKVAGMEKAAKEKSDKLQGRFDELKRVVVNAFKNIERKNARLQAQVTALEAKTIRLERESRAMKVLLARCMHAECLPPYPGPPALPQDTAAAPPSSNPPAYRS
ncbi:hypothetical protein WOLCODRAFT_152598 [Wolfiporia cocos MD-104 SS10]|uniref:Uncharacterized protein n=1 Tax=Wolfiporia cocos (strain MD-104) TaxID=742152 RepID=A0A2H3JM25_WOLCO|nr:hypothetical protein WOLCODRAFT_152598 [Wolfiporia cocos MD-104 SS10]